MTQLTSRKCTACRRDSPPVTDSEMAELSPQVPDWDMVTEDGIPKLDRVFRFKDFEQALNFTRAVGEAADDEGHHPRLVTEWGCVRVTWWTHKIRNLHVNDFIMAAKSDGIYREVATVDQQ